MRLAILQHVPFEGPAMIGSWAESVGHELDYYPLYKGAKPPGISQYDGLVVMGGPMGVYDEAKHPWLVEELQTIEAALQAERPLLGICLGAQMIAHVLGAPITLNEVQGEKVEEIGWMPIRKTAEGTTAATAPSWYREAPDEIEVFHWHGETFATPGSALRLFESDQCANQGFALGDKVVGLQFHLEMDQQAVTKICDAVGSDLTPSSTVQSVATMKGAPVNPACKQVLGALLDELFKV